MLLPCLSKQSNHYNTIHQTITDGYRPIFFFLLASACVHVGISLIAYVALGPQMDEFASYARSSIELLKSHFSTLSIATYLDTEPVTFGLIFALHFVAYFFFLRMPVAIWSWSYLKAVALSRRQDMEKHVFTDVVQISRGLLRPIRGGGARELQ